ncbi:MAG TPA: hypothetical protein DEO56_00890 [Nitrosomonas nitrosa]|nr:MAG: hypothetical protein NMNS02_24520 [Nitrosomonas sp.]HBZ29149.1 hypothetical protein [Nitrosomonas nitrosa]
MLLGDWVLAFSLTPNYALQFVELADYNCLKDKMYNFVQLVDPQGLQCQTLFVNPEPPLA